MTSYNKGDAVGPWAKDKLDKLEKYLSAYTTILTKQSWCTNIVYLDAFAAMGIATIRQYNKNDNDDPVLFSEEEKAEEQEYINGSPLRALGLQNSFTDFAFVELDPDRVKELEKICAGFPDKKITIIQEDCNTALFKYLNNFNWKTTRAVLFLDPFGAQIPWGTITKIAAIGGDTKPIEIILNLPIQITLSRFLPNDYTGSDKAKKQVQFCNDFFGSDEWFNLIYEQQGGLFGNTTKKIANADDVLANWYAGRLKDLFGASSPPYMVKNTKNRGLYYLIWAGKNATGQKIASDVLTQGEKVKIKK